MKNTNEVITLSCSLGKKKKKSDVMCVCVAACLLSCILTLFVYSHRFKTDFYYKNVFTQLNHLIKLFFFLNEDIFELIMRFLYDDDEKKGDEKRERYSSS